MHYYDSKKPQENIERIRSLVPRADIYNQLAEEASELAQCANKMARAIRGTNPTPKSEEAVMRELIEEYTDVINVAYNVLELRPDWLIADYKLHRWKKRLEEKECRKIIRDQNKP